MQRLPFYPLMNILGQFEGRSQLSTWLTTIVTNVSLMKLRRYSRHEMLSLDQNYENDGPTLANELKDKGPNPEKICVQTELSEKLRRALEQAFTEAAKCYTNV